MDFKKEELWLLRKKKLTMGWSGFNLAAKGLPAINEAITKRVGFIEQQEKELLADRYCCCSYCDLFFYGCCMMIDNGIFSSNWQE